MLIPTPHSYSPTLRFAEARLMPAWRLVPRRVVAARSGSRQKPLTLFGFGSGRVRSCLRCELRSRHLKSKHVMNASKNEPILPNRLSPVYTISGSVVPILPADCPKFAQSRACGVAEVDASRSISSDKPSRCIISISRRVISAQDFRTIRCRERTHGRMSFQGDPAR
jgi:hypothetical protein